MKKYVWLFSVLLFGALGSFYRKLLLQRTGAEADVDATSMKTLYLLRYQRRDS